MGAGNSEAQGKQKLGHLEVAASLKTALDGPWGEAINRTFWGSALPFLLPPKLSSIWKEFYFFSNVDANFEIFLF